MIDMLCRASIVPVVLLTAVLIGCGDSRKGATSSHEDHLQPERQLIEQMYPGVREVPKLDLGAFAIEAQRRLRDAQDTTMFAYVAMPNIVERDGSVFFEAAMFPDLHMHLTLRDSKGLTQPLISSNDKLKRFGRYVVVFVLKDLLQPQIRLRSEVSGGTASEEPRSDIVVVTEDFPIIRGDLVYLKRIDE